jgi:hypothetical protein
MRDLLMVLVGHLLAWSRFTSGLKIQFQCGFPADLLVQQLCSEAPMNLQLGSNSQWRSGLSQDSEKPLNC